MTKQREEWLDSMNIVIAVQVERNMAVYFPEAVMAEIKKLGSVSILDLGKRRDEAALTGAVGSADVLMSHWGTPRVTAAVLDSAPNLRLIAHCTGSVADLVSDAVYERGIKVCSANSVMARFVAEGALAYMLSGLRLMCWHDARMKAGGLWEQKALETKTLFGARVGLVGLGTVGMYLLELLKPFGVDVRLYDPYVKPEALEQYPWVKTASLEDTLAWGSVVSIHASLTPETRHMIGAKELRRISDGALLVNTARGAVLDEAALAAELSTGRFRAVLDVFETEPLPPESPLRHMENVTLQPHLAGVPVREEMALAMAGEVGRFLAGEPLQYEISYEKYRLMTRETRL